MAAIGWFPGDVFTATKFGKSPSVWGDAFHFDTSDTTKRNRMAHFSENYAAKTMNESRSSPDRQGKAPSDPMGRSACFGPFLHRRLPLCGGRLPRPIALIITHFAGL